MLIRWAEVQGDDLIRLDCSPDAVPMILEARIDRRLEERLVDGRRLLLVEGVEQWVGTDRGDVELLQRGGVSSPGSVEPRQHPHGWAAPRGTVLHYFAGGESACATVWYLGPTYVDATVAAEVLGSDASLCPACVESVSTS